MSSLSVESASYTQSQAQFISNVKKSAFARFLNKVPYYVTYYVNNTTLSKTDAGTGAVYEEIGPQSSMRFNRVSNLPAYNIPELRPDVLHDEGGYDIEMDITDIGFIPGTVRPKPADYMLVEIPGAPKLLFRCNAWRHNSIMSQDFYLADFDLVDIGDQSQLNRENSTELRNGNYIEQIEKQCVRDLVCRAIDVGTNEKYIVDTDDAQAIADADELIDTLTQFFNDSFYNAEIDAFALMTNPGNVPVAPGTQWYVDNYQTRFINESEIFRNDSSDYTVRLAYPEMKQLNFDYLYKRSVWYAVLTRSKDYLTPYLYAWNRMIQRRTSPLMLYSIPAVHPTLQEIDHYVQPEAPYDPNLKDLVYTPGQWCGWTGTDPAMRSYFNIKLVRSLQSNTLDPRLNYVERMIFQYVCRGVQNVTYKKDELLKFAFTQDLFTFQHLPIVIAILKAHRASLVASES